MLSQLPAQVIKEDRQLAQAADDLAKLRWHWTLDESNSKRVSFRAYAEAVGRSHVSIRSSANGYAAFIVASGNEFPTTRSLTDHIELAKLSDRKQAATEALADAQGLTVSNVAATQRDRVKDVVELAEAAAERRGTSVEEEIPRAAISHHRTREHAAKQRAEHKKRHTMRYIEMEGHLAGAKQRLTDALKCAQDVNFDDEEAELIADSIRNVSALLRLLDARFVGTSGTDWDAELARIGGAT